jgi:hypothetical protein
MWVPGPCRNLISGRVDQGGVEKEKNSKKNIAAGMKQLFKNAE